MVKSSYSLAEIARHLGIKPHIGKNNEKIKERCDKLKLSTEHFKIFGKNTTSNRRPLEEILVQNSNYLNLGRLKIRLVNEGILKYRCAICGNTGTWMGEPLSLQLDHINGDHLDHRIENLRFLCPNCHSQQPTSRK